MQVICSGMKDELITMEGTGILQLRQGCIAKTTYVTLIGIQHLESQEQYLYQPNLLLNISEILPQIHKYHDVRPLDTKYERASNIVEDTISGIEEKLEEIGRHHRNKRFSNHLLHGGLTLLSIFALGLLLYCTRGIIWRLLSTWNCKRRKPRTPPDAADATEEGGRSCPPKSSATTSSLPCQRAIVD